MAGSLRLMNHLSGLRQCGRCPPVASFTINSPQFSRSQQQQNQQKRKFTQLTYDRFFAPTPVDPSLWNQAILSAEWYYSALHDLTGISWGWTVILGTLILRSVVTFPCMILSELNQDRMVMLYQEHASGRLKDRLIKEIEEMAFHAPNIYDTKKKKEKVLNDARRQIMREEYKERNCHPWKGFALPIVQIPLFFVSSIALRNMSGSYVVDGARIPPTCVEMSGESFLWIPDLCMPDGSGVISVMLFIAYVTLVEVNLYKSYDGQPMGRRGKILTYFLRGFTLVLPAFALAVPSTVSLYWLTSALVGLTHNILVMSPSLRRSVGITLRASPYDTPARTIWAGFKSYWKIADKK